MRAWRRRSGPFVNSPVSTSDEGRAGSGAVAPSRTDRTKFGEASMSKFRLRGSAKVKDTSSRQWKGSGRSKTGSGKAVEGRGY